MNQFLFTENLKTRYEYIKCEDSTAETILLVHGLGLDMSTWDEVVHLLKLDFHILRYDIREHGKSIVNKRENFSWELLINDVELLLKELSIQRFHLIGHSSGGNLGIELAVRNDNIQSLTLISTPIYFPEELGEKELEDRKARNKASNIEDIIEPLVNSICYPPTNKKIIRLKRVYKQISAEAYLDYANLLAKTILSYSVDQLKKVTIPKLVLVGEFDVFYPPKLQMISMNYLTNSRFYIIQNASNAIMIDQPDEFIKSFKNFLSGIRETVKVNDYLYSKLLSKELDSMVDKGINNNSSQTNTEPLIFEDTYQSDVRLLMSSVASIRHDFTNHIQVMHGLLKLEEYEKAFEYVSSLFKEVHAIDTVKFNKDNPGLSVLLQTKMLTSQNHQIDIQFSISNDPFDRIGQTDLIKILSNLIDNAIDAAIELPVHQRKIKIGCKAQSNMYIFEIENTGPTIQDMEQIFKKGYSTKKAEQGKIRGHGLYIVREIVNRYDGHISFQSSDFYTTAIVKIPNCNLI
jgi:pimeloyl-ACP methyl ester carboxylesterase